MLRIDINLNRCVLKIWGINPTDFATVSRSSLGLKIRRNVLCLCHLRSALHPVDCPSSEPYMRRSF